MRQALQKHTNFKFNYIMNFDLMELKWQTKDRLKGLLHMVVSSNVFNSSGRMNPYLVKPTTRPSSSYQKSTTFENSSTHIRE